jgi:putative transposase
LADTLGLPLSIYVAPVEVVDRDGARLPLAGSKLLVPRLQKIRADGAYGGESLAEWSRGQSGWKLEIAEREREAGGFEVLAKRWIVEQTFAWLGRSRRLSKDCERGVQTGETMIEVAMIRLLLRRLVPRT